MACFSGANSKPKSCGRFAYLGNALLYIAVSQLQMLVLAVHDERAVGDSHGLHREPQQQLDARYGIKTAYRHHHEELRIRSSLQLHLHRCGSAYELAAFRGGGGGGEGGHLQRSNLSDNTGSRRLLRNPLANLGQCAERCEPEEQRAGASCPLSNPWRTVRCRGHAG